MNAADDGIRPCSFSWDSIITKKKKKPKENEIRTPDELNRNRLELDGAPGLGGLSVSSLNKLGQDHFGFWI